MNRVVILSIVTALLVSCSPAASVKAVAEKALVELGNGKYAGDYLGRNYYNLNILDLFKSPYFADYEIENHKASNFMENGQTKYDRDLKEVFFETDILFDEIVFVEFKQLHPRDIFDTRFISQYSEDFMNEYSSVQEYKDRQTNMMEIYKDEPGFYKKDYDYCYIEHQDVPFYSLTYKLDNKYLATVTVARIKGEKPKVTSVFIR